MQYEKHGFRFEQTGGGCTAYVLQIGNVEFLITDDMTMQVPDETTERFIIGAYVHDPDTCGQDQIDYTEAKTATDAIAAVWAFDHQTKKFDE